MGNVVGEEKAGGGNIKLLGLLSTLKWSAVAAWLVTLFTAEQLVFVLAFVALCLTIAVIVCSRYPEWMTYSTLIVGADGQPHRLPVVNRLHARVAYVLATAIPVVTLGWYFYGGRLVPSASMGEIDQSVVHHLPPGDDGKVKSVRTVPNRFFIPHDAETLQQIEATGAARFAIHRHGSFRSQNLLIESVGFEVEHVPFEHWRLGIGLSPPQHAVMPFRFSATLAPDVRFVQAQMIGEDGQPTEGRVRVVASPP